MSIQGEDQQRQEIYTALKEEEQASLSPPCLYSKKKKKNEHQMNKHRLLLKDIFHLIYKYLPLPISGIHKCYLYK